MSHEQNTWNYRRTKIVPYFDWPHLLMPNFSKATQPLPNPVPASSSNSSIASSSSTCRVKTTNFWKPLECICHHAIWSRFCRVAQGPWAQKADGGIIFIWPAAGQVDCMSATGARWSRGLFLDGNLMSTKRTIQFVKTKRSNNL